MMASFMSYFGARRDPKQTARDAIVNLRQQLQMIAKKEEYLQKKIDEETQKARANAVSNRNAATAALKRKKMSEQELDRLSGSRLQLEMQVNTLESANLNAETMSAMKKASDALKVIHGNLTIDRVDATMAAVNEQRELANEIAESLSNGYAAQEVDEVCSEDELKAELDDLAQEELNHRLSEADHAPVHLPPGATRAEEKSRIPAKPVAVEDDEEAQLKELQAALAM
ncbi:Snf7-domain-containing protein [Crassisporium funariophilum]|nr:Snf7-domain-containing protein [Crassisporium funariophilum]